MANEYDLIRIPAEKRSPLAAPMYGPPAPPPPVRVSAEFTWRQFVRVLRKQWRFSALFSVAFLAVLITVTLFMKDTYEAKARLEILPPVVPAIVTLRESVSWGVNEQDYFQTQIEILKSDALGIAVIEKLHLDQNSEFVGKPGQRSLKTAVLQALHLDRSLKTSPQNPTEVALKHLKQELKVEQIRTSRIAEITFAGRNPRTTAEVTATLVRLYLEGSHRARYEATMKAAQSLSGELEELRAAMKQANQALAEFQNTNNILEYSESDGATSGSGVRQNAVTQRVAELNRQLNQAQAERIQQESYVKLIQAGSSESLPQMRDNPVLQDLTKRYVEARAQLAQAMAVFGQNNPNARKLHNQVDELGAQLAAERQRIVQQVKTGYQAAATRERLLSQALDQMKGSVDRMNEKMLRYNQLRKEAQANSDLYISVSSRLKEAAISGSLNATNIRVVDPARVPERPARPKRMQIISLGAVFSVLAGLALALLKESMDDTIRTHEDVKAWTGLAPLATFPLIASANSDRRFMPSGAANLLGSGSKKAKDVSELRFFLKRPHSAETEAVRSLVTSIKMSTQASGDPVRVILLVSPFQNEGKTTVAVNLAMALARYGKTCLIDADLRNPMVARTFGVSFQQGLQDVLTGSAPLKEVLQAAPNVPNLTLLPAGPGTSSPGELISSELMNEVMRGARESFDNIVIDAPPVIPYSDARWLSSLVDGVVIVARSRLTTRQALVWSTEMLTAVRAPVLGVVLNGADLEDEYYGYSQHKYTEA